MYVDDIYYTTEDLAKLFKVHPRTIIRLIENGQLEASKIGGQWRISASSLGKMLEETKNNKKEE